MLIANTLDLRIEKDKIVYDGVVINAITVRGSDTHRIISISPKHNQSFVSGNLMVSDTEGLILVPIDEVNNTNECVVLFPNGMLSKAPELLYEDYLKRKKEFEAQKFAAAQAEETYKK